MDSTGSEPVVRLEKVSQRYGKAVALDDVTLDVPAGKMIGLIGPDGVGKSTLLAMAAGVRKIQRGKVLTLDDLSDVYMYVFLPTDTVGKVALNSEARIVLDAIPQYPIKAFVSFISPNAQFTPKTVETAQERHNLTFRVKLQIPKDRLREFEPLVKAGVPGMGYVRLDQNLEWPAQLQWKDPRNAPWWHETGAASPTADSGK